MPRVKRTEICAQDEVQAFHLINRCVRRTYLCGKDRKSGKDYSHRKQWIRERLEELAGIFGIDVLGFAVMSNHLHVVVRTRPDVVQEWSDDEITLRWWRLFPQRRNEDHSAAEPTEFELNAIRNDKAGLKEKRKRLADISWFMRCLAEPIARRGNKDDEVTGRFWEGRFKAQPLLDETALAACMAYVDLNPIRAGIAATPETSDFTSVQERIADACGECSVFGVPSSESSMESGESPSSGLSATFSPAAGEKGRENEAEDQRIEHGRRAGWLSPIADDPSRKKVREKPATRRASNRGILPMSLEEYLRLLDWTGRQLRRPSVERGTGKRGKIPADCAPILDRLECSAETWLDFVQNFRKRFRVEAGLPQSLRTFRSLRQCRRTTATTS